MMIFAPQLSASRGGMPNPSKYDGKINALHFESIAFVKIDDADDIKNWLEGEEEAENEEVAGTSGSSVDEGATLPDDNISQYGGDDDSADSGE